MLDFLLFIIFPIVCFMAGYVYRETLLFRDMMRVAKNLDRQLAEEIKKNIPDNPNITVKKIRKLKHEIINDVHYFFTEKDDTFICQGSTLEIAAENYCATQGKDSLGYFKHPELDREYCFVNCQCVEVANELN